MVLGHEGLLAQSQYLSENRIFDQVKDRFGNNYQLADIAIRTSTNLTSSVPSNSCVAGYFTLYFAPGSALDFNPGQTAIICEVFRNISALIVSNLPAGSINIRCDNLPANSTALGVASSYYVYPFAPANVNQGIIYSQVQKALLTGADSYSNLPISNFLGGGNFYHGRLDIANIANWHVNLNTTNIAASDYDLYSVVLHEVGHLIGVNSLLSSGGTSLLGSNYYSKFDQYLFDSNSNPLLVPSSTLCPTSSLAFAASTLALAPGTCPSTQTNVTTCTAAVQYVSPNLNLKVYTPDCFETGSSLSHFEDMCSTITFTPSGPGASCSPTPAAPGFNDQYFSISNANFAGPCYVKRYLKQEEKCVLSDLGYSTTTTYTSIAVLSGTSQTASYSLNCPPVLQIVGLNDGLQNGNYTFTSSTTDYVLLPGQLLSNDVSPSALQVSCLELIYSNATITPGATDYTITAPPGIGLVLLKYYPTDGNGNFGNVAYVYVYFTPPGCNSVANCNLIQNGGFETNQTTNNATCGLWGSGFPISVSCWAPYLFGTTPTLYGTACTPASWAFTNLGVNTYSTQPPISAINFTPVPNNFCVSLRASVNNGNSLAIKNNLSANLIPGQSYELSLWAINAASTALNPVLNPSNLPLVISIASFSNFAFTPTLNFPSGLNTITQFTLSPSTSWSQLTYTFVYSSPTSVQANALIIGIDQFNSTIPTFGFFEMFLDEISLTPLSTPQFAPPTTSVCGSNNIVDLGQFISFGSGVFSGPGVTQNGLQYDFNSAQTLGAGNYAIAYSYTNNNCSGVKYQQVTLPLVTNCCSNTLIPAYTQSSITGPLHIWLGPMRFTNDFTIPSGTEIQILGEVAISPSVQITVSNNATLTLMGAHLFACGLQMWKGIVVQNGGQLRTQFNANSCLIEDAITAIDVSNHTSASGQYILNIENTIFNKNKCSINITNYQATTSANYPFVIRSNVFTCREIPFSGTNWPNTGLSAQGSGTSAQLRYAIPGSTTGLLAPYLGNTGFQICNLKAPFNSQTSEIAISLADVGTTIGNTFFGIVIGDDASPGNFNLFDYHEEFIVASNCNIHLKNNVFQNTRNFLKFIGAFPNQSIYMTGTAIKNVVNQMNSAVTMTASASNLGNRFWDCYQAVFLDNVFRFNCTNTLVRSTRNSTVSGWQPGYAGLQLATNRFQYSIEYNDFTNVSYPIGVGIGAGPFNTPSTGPQFGIYADIITIKNNLIASGTQTFESVNNAVNLSWLNQVPPTIAQDYGVAPYTKAIVVEQNTMTAVERGISINGVTGFQTTVESNNISLRTSTLSQYGIDLSNCSNANNVGQQYRVLTNTVTGTGTGFTEALYRIRLNAALYAPQINCNVANSGYEGFVFGGQNTPTSSVPGTQWYGNTMENLSRGMVLRKNGEIGMQGSSLIGSGNTWTGAGWNNAANFHTWTDSSFATFSPLFYAAGNSSLAPLNNAGVPFLGSYAMNFPLTVSSGGNYSCSDPSARTGTFASSADSYGTNAKAIKDISLYRFLLSNDSIRNADPALASFFGNMAGTNAELLSLVEDHLYQSDFAGAQSLLSGMTPLNSVEGNYKLFYSIYANYLQGRYDGTAFNAADSVYLATLSDLCPEVDGACVFQARALYQKIYNRIFVYNDCQAVAGARGNIAASNGIALKQTKGIYNITPNPATDFIEIDGPKDRIIRLTVINAFGIPVIDQVIFFDNKKTIPVNELINGLYEMIISDNTGSVSVMKSVISK